ncbi:outer membrane protein assembly factor BamE [Corallococcus sp. AB038B]|uniref:outer membrane protein assembly factor BamE domain-containing protein n=1 Tax=Corallococcus sp. AB038B TaxID=2316718 RepID=UPI000EC6C995|nr:outer membrane protein assembly factor BamE [Corallococcus sp. AB038B]RKH98177.1 outer membrane protein assembly factor BamE [Corallococcus sp. AB038B]
MDAPEAPVLFRASMGRPQAWWDRLFLGLVSTGAALFYAGFGVPWSGSHLAPGLTAEKVRSVSPGMSEDEVVQRLGMPLAREVRPSGRLSWDYANPVAKVRRYPKVYVTFESGRVFAVEVELKTFWGVDEEVLYLRTSDRIIQRPDLDDVLP